MIVVLVVFTAITPAQAAPCALGGVREARIEQAQAALSDVLAEQAIELADSVLADAKTGCRARIEALRIKGSALTVLEGRGEAAAAAFREIFAFDSEYQLADEVPARYRSAFEAARAAWLVDEETRLRRELGPRAAAIKLDVRPPVSARGGNKLVLDVAIVDPEHLGKTVLFGWRRRGQPGFATRIFDARPVVRLELGREETSSPTPYELEWYLRLRVASGGALRNEGSNLAPRRIAVAAGVYDPPNWWLRGGIAVAVAALAVYVGTRDAGPQTVRVTP